MGVFFLLAIASLFAGLLSWGQRQRARQQEAFSNLGRHYGLSQQGPQKLVGRFGRGTLEVILTTERRGSGKSRRSVSVTRYRLVHDSNLRMGLKVYAQSQFFGDIAEALGMVKDIRVGRTDLDDAMRIGALDPQHAAAVLTGDAVSHALLSARYLRRFYVNDQEAFAQHDGWVTEAARFETHVRPLSAVVDALAASRAQHRANWESEIDRVWGAVATPEGLGYAPERSLLWTSTPAGSIQLGVSIVNNVLATHVRIVVDRPRNLGLQMTPSRALSALGTLLGMQDLTLGVPVLDEAYVIKARDETEVRAVLLSIAGDLTKIHEAFPNLTISDAGLSGSRDRLLLDAVALTALLRAMRRVLDGLAGATPEPSSAFR